MVVMVSGGKMLVYILGLCFGFIFDELGFIFVVSFIEVGNYGNVVIFEFIFNVNFEWLFVFDCDNVIGCIEN